MPPRESLSDEEVDLVLRLIDEGHKVTAITRRLNISDTIFYRIRDGKHPVQVRRRQKREQMLKGAICPVCGRTYVEPCTVCQIRRNIITVGEMSPKAWDLPKPPAPVAPVEA